MQIPRSERGTDRARETERAKEREGEREHEKQRVGDKQIQTEREDGDGGEHRKTEQV